MFKKRYIQINIFLIIIVWGLYSIPCYSSSKEDPIDLFNQKKYEEALPLFKVLLQKTPDDITLFYYVGACLTETNHFGNETIMMLQKSISDNQPNLLYFYLGENYHALNDFKTAITYYSIFEQKVGKKELKGLNIDAKVDMCKKRINPFTIAPPIAIPADSLSTETALPDTSQIQNRTKTSSDTVKNKELALVVPASLNGATINFILTSEIYYTRFSQFRTYNGKQNFIAGWNNTDSLNWMVSETDSLRNEYRKIQSSEIKASLSNKVIDLENKILKSKSLIDGFYFKANEFEFDYWKKAPEKEKLKLIAENDSLKRALEQAKIVIVPKVTNTDTVRTPAPEIVDSTSAVVNEPSDEKQKVPPVVFKIQIGKYNTALPESTKKLFKKISVLRKIDQYTDENKFTVYTIGELTSLNDAVKLQDQIRQESVKDAFVIAIKDGKRISLKEAQELLK